MQYSNGLKLEVVDIGIGGLIIVPSGPFFLNKPGFSTLPQKIEHFCIKARGNYI